MDFQVRSNLNALFAHRQMNVHNVRMGKALQRLSSGLRVNSAADDPALFSRAANRQLRAMMAESQRRQNDNMLGRLGVIEGVLAGMQSMLGRLVDVATEGANGSLAEEDRAALQTEMDVLVDEMRRSVDAARYNGAPVFGAARDESPVAFYEWTVADRKALAEEIRGLRLTLAEGGAPQDEAALHTQLDKAQEVYARDLGYVLFNAAEKVGEASFKPDEFQKDFARYQNLALAQVQESEELPEIAESYESFSRRIGVNMGGSFNGFLDKLDGLSVMTQEDAGKGLDTIRAISDEVSAWRAGIGTAMNALERRMAMDKAAIADADAADSLMLDADMAKEMVTFVKEQHLAQAAGAMLSHSFSALRQTTDLLRLMGMMG